MMGQVLHWHRKSGQDQEELGLGTGPVLVNGTPGRWAGLFEPVTAVRT